MTLEGNDDYRDMQSLHDKCKSCMHYHTILTMKDGSTVDGIIVKVDTDHIIVLVGEDVMEREDENKYDRQRQYGNPRRGRRRFRRFRHRRFPFATLAALSLLPYPYFAPPYPFYPYFPF
ncbi:hypothetical protein HAHI6034_06125 [Hathewaya histolytica]|uniref:Uncharacterized protein n=2 Tax=Hathewaya histolytica TaxID=1498 RepID=A0A4U9RVV1_HATHI|nr:hypothetical protein [Hathewaya histolytica]VTQ95948.1 Uncharacterised protein [Hathewaya histolytica]